VLERICGLAEVVVEPVLAAAANEQLARIRAVAKPIRDYRNKYLAHLDLPTALQPTGDVIPGIKREDVDAFLEAAAWLFNRVDGLTSPQS
jgi:hypothetical protein